MKKIVGLNFLSARWALAIAVFLMAYASELQSIELKSMNSQQCEIVAVAKRNSDIKRTICQATLLSSQKVAFTPTCLPTRINKRFHRLQVQCLDGLIKQELGTIAKMSRDDNGIVYIEAPIKIELPLRKSSKVQINEDCFFKDKDEKLALKDYKAQKINLWGSPVYCKENNEEVIVGILGATGAITFSQQEVFESGATYTPDQAEQNVCSELGNCLDDLVGLPDDLQDKIAVIKYMLRNENPELKGATTQLEIDAYKLLQKCHQEKIESELAPKKIEQGFFASLTGLLEETYVDVFNTNAEIADKVLDSSKDQLNDIEGTKSKIVQALETEENKNLSSLDKIKLSAKIVAKEVLKEKMSALGITDETQQKSVLIHIMPNFENCLANAVNATTKVKECSKILQEQAPLVIGRMVVEKNFETNFSNQFENDEDREKFKELTVAAYERCVADFYLASENKEKNKEELTKACVYESITTGFKLVVEEKIESNLAPLTLSQSEKLSLQKSIIKEGLTCPLGSTIKKVPNFGQGERQYLAKIDSKEYEAEVKICQNRITSHASDILVPIILRSHQDVVKSYPDSIEREKFVVGIIDGPYQNCKDWFAKNKHPYSVDVCEGVVRHYAFAAVASRELSAKAKSYGVQDNLEVMLNFKACNMRIEAELIAKNADPDREKKELNCLELAVSDLAAAAVPLKIEEELDKVASVAPIKDAIMNSDGIKALAPKMKECLSKNLSSSTSLTAFNTKLEQSIEDCTFEITKAAYSEIVPFALEVELSKNIPDPTRRVAFIEKFKKEQLLPKIAQLRPGADSNTFMADIKKDVMINFAKTELDSLLNGPLNEIKDTQKRQELREQITAAFMNCIEKSQNVDECPSQVTLIATKKIGGAALEENIYSFLKGDEARVLSEKTKAELESCIARLETADEVAAKACVGSSAIKLTANVPKKILKDYAQALGSKLPSSKLEAELDKVSDFYETGRSSNFNNKDRVVTLYASHQTCLSNARLLESRSELTLEKAMEISSECSTIFEASVVDEMRKNFTGVSTSKTIRAELSKIFDILLLFRDAPSEETAKSGESENLGELMSMIATMSKAACNYDLATCKDRVAALKKEMHSYASSPPKKSIEKLKEKLVKSSFMDLIIEAQVALSLKGELTSGLASMKDKAGYLDQSIATITSPKILRSIMKSNRGKYLLAEVKAKILAGQTENLTESPRIKGALANALLANTGNNSFIDHLFYGIVEPQIIEKKGSLSGIMGRALGIVKGNSFTWREVRKTPEGQQARALFARFFSGVVTGDVKASDIKNPPTRLKSQGYPSEKEIVDLITKGLKSL